MNLPFFWVDAFAQRAFQGNPAGVVPLDHWLDAAQMQQIAFENGLAETAFFVRTGTNRFDLRWFTPAVEVDLCGHATLASAYVLFHQLDQSGSELTFDSRSGPLNVSRQGDRIVLDFPARVAAPLQPSLVPESVRDCLLPSSPAHWLKIATHDYYLAVFSHADDVHQLKPNFTLLASREDARIIATAPGIDSDFVSRFFAPGAGVPEDPVTGSAHCTLIPYWSTRLGKTELFARQVSQRGGELWCSQSGDRVKIAGHAVLYLSGDITI
jgi:PhzF family phenazine biosynthesis protein